MGFRAGTKSYPLNKLDRKSGVKLFKHLWTMFPLKSECQVNFPTTGNSILIGDLIIIGILTN